MNAALSIPTGKGKYPKDPAAFENVSLESVEEIVNLVNHPRLKEVTSVSLFVSRGEDPAIVEQVATQLRASIAFRGEVRKMTTANGSTLFQIIRRAAYDASEVLALLATKRPV